MENLEFWMLFFSACVALNLAPGPDMLYILTKTASGGRKVGWAAAMGVCSGAMIHATIAAFGLSAILFASATAFMLVKLIGAAYLLYLAWQSFRSSGTRLLIGKDKSTGETPWQAYRQGVLVDVLNPKVALFFMAFLPQFVREGHGAVGWQMFYLGALLVTTAIVIETGFVFLAGLLTRKLHDNRRISIWLDRTVGAVFVLLAAKLLVSAKS